MSQTVRHIPVLLKEIVENLALKKGDVVLDGTVGDGGHAQEICSYIGAKGLYIGLDLDMKALAQARKNLQECSARVILEKENFKNIDSVLQKYKIKNADKILFDIGLRTGELEESGRGFSFRKDEPLLMTFDADILEGTRTAYEIVNTWKEEEIAEILKEYGEERFYKKIAREIVATRKHARIGRTCELVEVISRAIPNRYQHGRLHFATKTFQALRIAVNDELENLKIGVEKGVSLLAPGGRMAVISFHSLEDRIVKNIFREVAKSNVYALITKKPIVPFKGENMRNPRARSAKLRVIERSLR